MGLEGEVRVVDSSVHAIPDASTPVDSPNTHLNIEEALNYLLLLAFQLEQT